MAPKSIALLIAGVIIISALFTIFQVTYPTGQPVNPHTSRQQMQLFQYQFLDKNLLGNSSTKFTPSGNGTVNIEGYVHNASSGNAIGDAYLYSAVFPAETYSQTNFNGFYKITVIKYGKGTFAFQIPGFNPKFFNINLYGSGAYWLNISLQPAQKYNISGMVQNQAGHPISAANLSFSDFIQNFNAKSNSTGGYGLSLYNGTYVITSFTPGFSQLTSPGKIVVSGVNRTDFTISLTPLTKPHFNVTGYIHNMQGKPVSSAYVTSSLINKTSITNSSGYYSIFVPTGSNTIIAQATGYGANITTIFVQSNLTDINLTLQNSNPFGGSGFPGSTGTGLSNIPPGSAGNITGSLGNHSSKVNYGNTTGGASGNPLLLQGYVNNSQNRARVADTYLYFYLNVNGSYYYESVMTDTTGHYSIWLNHTGQYYFFVYSKMYSNYTFSKWVNSSTWKNFSLTPVSSYVFTISGNIYNNLKQGIYGFVTVFPFGSIGTPVLQTPSNTKGYYSTDLVEGNYSLMASSYGFSNGWNNTTVDPLIANSVDNFVLSPASSIGSGISKLNGGSTGIPGVSTGNVTSGVNSTGGGNVPPTGSHTVNLTITLLNASNPNMELNNTGFMLYLKLDGVTYSTTNKTNSTGSSIIRLGYEGNYSVLVDTYYYYGEAFNITINHDTSKTVMLSPRPTYTATITLYNAYNKTAGGTVTVPYNTLYITNYAYTLNKVSSNQVTGTGTVYSYKLVEGNYSFTYSNPNYVQKSFKLNISNSANSTLQFVKPYIVIMHSDSAAVYSYNLATSGGAYLGKSVQVNAGTYLRYFAAKNTGYAFSANLGGNRVDQTSFALTAAKSVENIYLNVSSNTVKAARSSMEILSAQSGSSNLEVLTSYNYQNAVMGEYIYAISVNYTLGSSPALLMNGTQISTVNIASDTATFNTYYPYSSGNLNVTFESTYNVASMPSTQSIYYSQISVQYYITGLKSVNSSGGN